MGIKKRSLGLHLFGLALGAGLLGWALLFVFEYVVARQNLDYVERSPFQTGLELAVQEFRRIYCSDLRHSACLLEAKDEQGHALYSLGPNERFTRPGLYSTHLSLSLRGFGQRIHFQIKVRHSSATVFLVFVGTFGFLLGLYSLFLGWKYYIEKKEQLKNREMSLSLKTAEAAIGELAAALAHDIRTPLSALNIAVDSFSNNPQDARELIKASAKRIQYLADNLLNEYKSKSQSPLPAANLEPVDLPSLLENLVRQSKPLIPAPGNITLTVNDSSIRVLAQPHELLRLLSNLVQNSIEASTHSVRIEISAYSIAGAVVVKIKDQGKGIPLALATRMGQKGATFGKEKGTGLGVFHAEKSLVEWGGSLSYASVEGEGTTATIQLRSA